MYSGARLPPLLLCSIASGVAYRRPALPLRLATITVPSRWMLIPLILRPGVRASPPAAGLASDEDTSFVCCSSFLGFIRLHFHAPRCHSL